MVQIRGGVIIPSSGSVFFRNSNLSLNDACNAINEWYSIALDAALSLKRMWQTQTAASVSLHGSHLDVLNPSHVHPGLRLVGFELHGQFVALVGGNKTRMSTVWQCHMLACIHALYGKKWLKSLSLYFPLVRIMSSCRDIWPLGVALELFFKFTRNRKTDSNLLKQNIQFCLLNMLFFILLIKPITIK